MKHLFVFLIFYVIISQNLISQQNEVKYKRDARAQNLKEDGHNQYQSDQITTLDLLEALQLSDINIHKYHIGFFDKSYNMLIVIDEFKDGLNINADTLKFSNEYNYTKDHGKTFYKDYIDQIKIISKSEDSALLVKIETYGMAIGKRIPFKKYSKESMYSMRSYKSTQWVLNEKIPLLVYASSWKDEKYGFQRFCGVVILSKKDKGTEELLKSSPHYYMISYVLKGDE